MDFDHAKRAGQVVLMTEHKRCYKRWIYYKQMKIKNIVKTQHDENMETETGSDYKTDIGKGNMIKTINWVFKNSRDSACFFSINWSKTTHDPRWNWQHISGCLEQTASGIVVVYIPSLVKGNKPELFAVYLNLIRCFLNHLEQKY